MILADVNALLYAHRNDAVDHVRYQAWLTSRATGDEAFAWSDVILASIVRIATNPRVFRVPTPPPIALAFCASLQARPNAVRVVPGPRHWALFEQLCRDSGATAKLVPDAWLAALAIEHGCTLETTDADFGRFRGLRWRHPLATGQE